MSENLLLMEKINYSFDDKLLLEIALTHPSYNLISKKENYERLEFLGDRVLGLVISEKLFKKFYNESEGELAKRFSYLVCKQTLLNVAKDLQIERFLKIHEDFNGLANDSIIANSLEALIGAVYLDSNLTKTSEIILNLWEKYIKKHTYPPLDPKSKLQEWCLKNNKTLPTYNVLNKDGPDHKPTFTVEVVLPEGFSEYANGRSKQEAEINAAKKLIEKIVE